MAKIPEVKKSKVIHNTFSTGIIYIYSIPGNRHKGRLKIGSATTNIQNPTKADIEYAAKKRIEQQTKTADIHFILECACLAVTNTNEYFSDFDVHNVLIRSGYPRKSANTHNDHSEWFEINLPLALSAINAVKEGRQALSNIELTEGKIRSFDLRPNQEDAVEQTSKAIQSGRKNYLWNAKMRFGKTSAAMEVAKRNHLEKVLIVTHRPSVSADWYNDFKIIFAGTDYEYSSKTHGETISRRLAENKPFIYFASLQDIRLSKTVVSDEDTGSKAKGFDKNDEVFETEWDMLIVDEAHEGTTSNLGEAVFRKIPTKFTLELSGTPFNILYKRESNEVYTWDYVMEQEDKLTWDEKHPGAPNPYAELPELSMFTYDIDKYSSQLGNLNGFIDAADGAFKFHEFFRVIKDDQGNDTAEFAHKKMVNKFLDLLVDDNHATKFPYATEQYRSYNKHALWHLPNRVKVIEAMEKLLKNHPVFSKFGIVNISGNAKDDDSEDTDAKNRVMHAISTNDYTITLTGQRLTTGASIPAWTAVFMMSDTTSATTYLQTAFRCQTPAKIDGKLKTQGYVFDFAPDRTLKLVAEAIELNHKAGKINTPEQREAMERFLNFCPILAAEGGSMKEFDVSGMLRQLKKAVIERVSRNGFDDPKLYNDQLLQLTELEATRFNELKAIVGTHNTEHTNEVKVNNLGMGALEREQAEEAERKKKQKKQLTDEEKERLKKLNEAKEQRKSAISILRAVSIRMPMLVYGANLSVREDVSLEKFIDIVDDKSWEEFMPEGLTKDTFREFTKYYDEEVFKGVSHNIRAKAYDYDKMLPADRIPAIAEVFSTFKNPDKETVLTPWSVVNKQFCVTLGSYDFSGGLIQKTGKPEWKSTGEPTRIWSQPDVKILEVNSKSGLYPLLAAYNIYSRKLAHQKQSEDKVHDRLWRETLRDHIYVVCKSPMAKSITERTLAGYNEGVKMNIVYIDDLVEKLHGQSPYTRYNIVKDLSERFEGVGENVKFTAVVGNPPYQINTDTNFATPVYHLFFEAAKSLDPQYISLIHPARFLFNAGATPKDWNKQMLNDPHLSVPLYDPKSQNVFSGVDIKGGVCITFWDKNQTDGGLHGNFIAFEELQTILKKVGHVKSIDSIIYPQTKTTIALDSKFPNEVRLRPNYFDKYPDVFLSQRDDNHAMKIVGLTKGNKRAERYVDQTIVADPNLHNWKVFLPESNGSGAIGEVVSTPLRGNPLRGVPVRLFSLAPFRAALKPKAV